MQEFVYKMECIARLRGFERNLEGFEGVGRSWRLLSKIL